MRRREERGGQAASGTLDACAFRGGDPAQRRRRSTLSRANEKDTQ
jgi:hypothetical protein